MVFEDFFSAAVILIINLVMAYNVIKIDGGLLEGGGQILRMSAAFSAILQKPIEIFNIRGGRSPPGLRAQHMTGLKLVENISSGKMKNCEQGSTAVTFHPSKISSGTFRAETGTAGSVMLLFQVSMPCLLFANGPAELNLMGGTNAEFAPQIDHTLMAFKPVAEKFGVKFDCSIHKRGYFPKGGGSVTIKTYPVPKLSPVELVNVGEITRIYGRAYVAGVLPIKMAHLMADEASRILRKYFSGVPLKIERLKERPEDAVGNGSGIVLIAETSTGCKLGASALGKRDLKAEQVGANAANELMEEINGGGCVDQYVQDQVIILMALADGYSKVRTGPITLHTETAIHVAHLMTNAKFTISKEQDHNIIECDGIAMQRTN